MSTPTSNAFNQASEKVVSYGEWRQKTKALYKTNLSVGEKIFLYGANIPASFLQGGYIAIKDAIQGNKRQGTYIDDAKFPPKMFVSGAFLDAMIQEAAKLTFSKKFDDKLNALAGQAFEQCEDVSKTPKMKTLTAC